MPVCLAMAVAFLSLAVDQEQFAKDAGLMDEVLGPEEAPAPVVEGQLLDETNDQMYRYWRQQLASVEDEQMGLDERQRLLSAKRLRIRQKLRPYERAAAENTLSSSHEEGEDHR